MVSSFAFCALLGIRSRIEWRDVRVVEGARLESVCRGNSTVGSNPTLSAILYCWSLCNVLNRMPELGRRVSSSIGR